MNYIFLGIFMNIETNCLFTLGTIGNPVDLSRHAVISKTPAFLKYAISSALVIEPSQHPCLQMLPSIFLTAMKGISGLVDAFLGKEILFYDLHL